MSPHAWYGCRRDLRDFRDLVMSVWNGSVPTSVDLRAWCPPVMDQGPIGSCVWHALCAAARFHIIRRGTTYDFEMSRLQGYYDTRVAEGTVNSDAGCEIRNAIKTMSKRGIGHEELWPYDPEKFDHMPTQDAYDDAVQYKALRYTRVPVSARSVKRALAEGHPVIIGITLYESFESERTSNTGKVLMPIKGEKVVGGHAMLAVGYGQVPGHFTVRNSWGADWGAAGDCFIPDEYIGSSLLGADYWHIDLFGSDAEGSAGTA